MKKWVWNGVLIATLASVLTACNQIPAGPAPQGNIVQPRKPIKLYRETQAVNMMSTSVMMRIMSLKGENGRPILMRQPTNAEGDRLSGKVYDQLVQESVVIPWVRSGPKPELMLVSKAEKSSDPNTGYPIMVWTMLLQKCSDKQTYWRKDLNIKLPRGKTQN